MEMGVPDPIAPVLALELDLPPSCVQFCRAHPTHFVVGTYNLDNSANQDLTESQVALETVSPEPGEKKPQSRNGSLVVFRLDDLELTKVQTLLQPSAVLDLRFHPKHRDIFAVVSSTGTLSVLKLNPVTDAVDPLQKLSTSRCSDLAEDVLFLQCNWHPNIDNVLAVTTSTGLARLLQLDKDWSITESVDLSISNDLEPWSIVFSPEATKIDDNHIQTTVYCGGDDSILRYTACIVEQNNTLSASLQEQYAPIAVGRHHTAGVTALLPLPVCRKDGGRLVVTGSYDDSIRVFSIHDPDKIYGMKRVEVLLEEGLGGGVWRLDLVDLEASDESCKIRVLCSCMHAGARLVEIMVPEEGVGTCSVLARFEEHKSMNYGSDFVKIGDAGRLRCVSTSFYDKLLCLWEYEPGP